MPIQAYNVSFSSSASRVFKCAEFVEAAQKLNISDNELCELVDEAIAGKAEFAFGSVVVKKIFGLQKHYSAIILRCGQRWIFFSIVKNDKKGSSELTIPQLYSKFYENISDEQIGNLVTSSELMEVFRDSLKRFSRNVKKSPFHPNACFAQH